MKNIFAMMTTKLFNREMIVKTLVIGFISIQGLFVLAHESTRPSAGSAILGFNDVLHGNNIEGEIFRYKDGYGEPDGTFCQKSISPLVMTEDECSFDYEIVDQSGIQRSVSYTLYSRYPYRDQDAGLLMIFVIPFNVVVNSVEQLNRTNSLQNTCEKVHEILKNKSCSSDINIVKHSDAANSLASLLAERCDHNQEAKIKCNVIPSSSHFGEVNKGAEVRVNGALVYKRGAQSEYFSSEPTLAALGSWRVRLGDCDCWE